MAATPSRACSVSSAEGSQPAKKCWSCCNFTPVPRADYRVGVPQGGFWQELLNGDAPMYGGSGQGNMGGVAAVPIPCHGYMWSLNLTLPPLAIIFLKPGE